MMINISDTSYTNNRIGIDFLKHFIKHTKASPTSWYKLLLFDKAESYKTDKFKKLAKNHNIILYHFPSYLTHISTT
jgi:thioredoxin-related protein